MSEKELIVREGTLSLQEQTQAVASQIVQMLPQVKTLGPGAALALAHVALSLDLNPFIGEVWAIPQKGNVFALMTGIKGLRHAAHRQCQREHGHYTIEFLMPTAEQLEGLNVKQGDCVRLCRLEVWTDATRETFKVTGQITHYEGLGIYRIGESTRMEPIQVARKRAEADALKQAFDVPLELDSNHDVWEMAPTEVEKTARVYEQQVGEAIPNSPQALLTWVNTHREDAYDNLHHLLNAIKAELGQSWSWPVATDATRWQQAREAAMKHQHREKVQQVITKTAAILRGTAEDQDGSNI